MKGRSRRPVLFRIILLLLLASILCAAGLGAFFAIQQVLLAWPGSGLVGPSLQEGTPDSPPVNAEGTPIPQDQPLDSGLADLAAQLTPWDGAGRVTILLLGLDYRDWEAGQEASRSDTMILLTLDPQSKTAGILSIPRDLWVSIPGFKHGKINTAYYLGDAYEMPGGGPALAVKTVEQFLGIPINYYAQIDFGAFVRFIDEIGGVQVDVPQKITIDLLGTGFKTKKKLEPGKQVLPGEWALAYARARYTEGGDFDRAFRQQQVIMGIRDQIVDFDMMPTLIEKAPTLYAELASGIRTNLTLDQVLRLALLAQTVPEESIQRGIISEKDVIFGTSPDGLSILIPIPDDIRLLRDQIFASSSSLAPLTPGDAAQRMAAEGAKIALHNGSKTPDLAARTAEMLRGLGADVVQVDEAAQPYSTTTIIDHTSNPFSLRFLVDLISIRPTRIFFEYDPGSPYDVEVFLGDDWAAQ